MITNPLDIFQAPVSIADLPGHAFSVTPDTFTEKVVEELESRPDLPGVMIVENGQLFGVITRLKLFERLGHRFGVELFMQKPISQLKDMVRSHTQTMKAYLRIDEAIQYALSRSAQDIYDPIVVEHKDGRLLLLDINVLLLAQSRVMASMSNIVGNLEQIDAMISAGRDQHETFEKILNLLCHVVPFHQAAILALDETGLRFIASTGYRKHPDRADDILKSAIYSVMVKHRQSVYVPAAHQGPAWQGLECLGLPMAWLGVPFLKKEGSIGLLSISRNVERIYTSEERETAQAFAQRIIKLLEIDKAELHQKHNQSQLEDNSNQSLLRKQDSSVWFYGNSYLNVAAPINR